MLPFKPDRTSVHVLQPGFFVFVNKQHFSISVNLIAPNADFIQTSQLGALFPQEPPPRGQGAKTARTAASAP
jgi:hypothetical protein